MKYLIGNQCLNADHIVHVKYLPEDKEENEKSACFIDTDDSERVKLFGTQADLFWKAYIGDAYTVVNP